MVEALTSTRSPAQESQAAPKRGALGYIGRTTLPVRISLAVLAVAAGSGLLLSRLGEEDTPAPRTAAAGSLSLKMPMGWTRSASVPRIGDLDLENALTIVIGSGGGMVAGLAEGPQYVLDPLRAAAQVQASPARPTVVRLGRLEAYRWQGLRARKPERRVHLFVAPTSAGALTVACYGTGTTLALPPACARAAGTVRLAGATGYSPLRGTAWRQTLSVPIRRLRERRAVRERRLRRAHSAPEQARQAASLAGAHSAAVRELLANPAPPQASAANRRVVVSLRGLDRAYRRLGRAARTRNRRGYVRAARGIRREDARLRRALGSI